jgi:REP element-mobilizing transposase RayT
METFARLHRDGDATILAATIMPDHAHLLFVLGGRLSLGQLQAKLKTLARDRGRADWRWQEDAFEHKLRLRESTEDYGFYVFMNPYRAGLCGTSQRWPWWYCPDPTAFRFLRGLDTDGSLPAAWLVEAEQNEALITTRE